MPVLLVWSDLIVPAAPQRAEIRLGGEVVGDLDVKVCSICRRAVLEQIRVDPGHRRHGVARDALALMLDRWSGFSWSTTVLEPDAAEFWARVFWPCPELLGNPQWCAHMAAAESVVVCE
ncbi:GNAT family N-acetyltransferase [Saccharopolyspora shandongensis]|uniref:GNAT family N-acetyltransferase n=1 Tax=Saccharopolyspora shandongensis TaxID=418495 RepID=UPI0033F88FCE